MLRSGKSSGISLIYPRSLSRKQDRTLSRIGGSAPHPVWMFVRSKVGGGSAPPASEDRIYDARIEKKGRTNRRNTGKTSVDRSTKATLTLTIPGCN